MLADTSDKVFEPKPMALLMVISPADEVVQVEEAAFKVTGALYV